MWVLRLKFQGLAPEKLGAIKWRLQFGTKPSLTAMETGMAIPSKTRQRTLDESFFIYNACRYILFPTLVFRFVEVIGDIHPT
jgi:hypothetical protein